jgi:hypothetical protein
MKTLDIIKESPSGTVVLDLDGAPNIIPIPTELSNRRIVSEFIDCLECSNGKVEVVGSSEIINITMEQGAMLDAESYVKLNSAESFAWDVLSSNGYVKQTYVKLDKDKDGVQDGLGSYNLDTNTFDEVSEDEFYFRQEDIDEAIKDGTLDEIDFSKVRDNDGNPLKMRSLLHDYSNSIEDVQKTGNIEKDYTRQGYYSDIAKWEDATKGVHNRSLAADEARARGGDVKTIIEPPGTYMERYKNTVNSYIYNMREDNSQRYQPLPKWTFEENWFTAENINKFEAEGVIEANNVNIDKVKLEFVNDILEKARWRDKLEGEEMVSFLNAVAWLRTVKAMPTKFTEDYYNIERLLPKEEVKPTTLDSFLNVHGGKILNLVAIVLVVAVVIVFMKPLNMVDSAINTDVAGGNEVHVDGVNNMGNIDVRSGG